jgi:hypothetical protein
MSAPVEYIVGNCTYGIIDNVVYNQIIVICGDAIERDPSIVIWEEFYKSVNDSTSGSLRRTIATNIINYEY